MGVAAELVMVIDGPPELVGVIPLAPVALGPVSPASLTLYAASSSGIRIDVDLVAVATLVAVSVAVIVVTCSTGPGVNASGMGTIGFVAGVDVVAVSTGICSVVISQSSHLWTTNPVSLQ